MVKGRQIFISQLVCEWSLFLSLLFVLFLGGLYFGVIVYIGVKFGGRTVLSITETHELSDFSPCNICKILMVKCNKIVS